MEASSLSSIFNITSNNVVRLSNLKLGGGCLLKVKKNINVYCQSGNKAIKSSGSSSVITERSSTLINADQGAALMETSLILTPNGNAQTEIEVKDLVPYRGGTSTSMMERPADGIGITNFLGGKTFLVTGATGFLGKGIHMCVCVYQWTHVFVI